MSLVYRSCLSTLLIIAALSISAQAPVFIDAREKGRGILRSSMDKCFVVTPLHVVKESMGVTVYGRDGLSAAGGNITALTELDLAIVNLPSANNFDCNLWPQVKDYKNLLDIYTVGNLEMCSENGYISRIFVNITGYDDRHLTIVPQDSRKPIKKTWSGSPLYITRDGKKILLGMVMSIDSLSQVGYALRRDNLMQAVEPYFPSQEPKYDVNTAQSILDRALEHRDRSSRGQVEAMESLIAHGQKFTNADLRGISLQDADLAEANFQRANMKAVIVTGAKAENANFSGADLQFATMDEANLQKAEMVGTVMPFVNAEGAGFEAVSAGRSEWMALHAPSADFSNADLRSAGFAFANLRSASFEGADLSGTIFFACDLRGASFKDAIMDGTDFTGSHLSEGAFSGKQKRRACQRTYENRYEGSPFMIRIRGMEKIPNLNYNGGFSFEDFNNTYHLFWLPDNKLQKCDQRPLPDFSLFPVWQSRNGEINLNDQIWVRLHRELLRGGSNLVEIKSRIHHNLDWLYPFPSGKYHRTIESSEVPPEHRELSGSWTIEFTPGGELLVSHRDRETISVIYERGSWYIDYHYTLNIRGDFRYFGCSDAQSYRFRYTPDRVLTLKPISGTGYSEEDDCTLRNLILGDGKWRKVGD